MSIAETPAPIRHAPLALWRVAQAFLTILHSLFGAPEDVARRHTLAHEAHAPIASWLRVGEALLRKLPLIEAAAYPKPDKRPPPRSRSVRLRRPYEFTHDAPEAWRVSFRVFPATLRHAQRDAEHSGSLSLSRATRSDAKRFCSAWPLAERYEALLRVFNDPVAAARRLAARLFARPRDATRVLAEPAEAEHRVDRHAELCAAAGEAVRTFNSS